MRGRMYDPVAARFMSVDPIVEDVHDAQTWNPYSYVSNRPLTLVDPTGLGGVDDGGGGSVDPDVAADEDPVDWQGGCTGGRNSEDGACVKLVGPPETEIADSSAGVYAEGVAAAMGFAEPALVGAEMGLGSAGARALSKETVCFAAGTVVLTEEGLRGIETVEVGDLVWARDDETGEESWERVVEVFVTPQRELLELTFEADDGTRQRLHVTPEHPLWSLDDGEWDDAGNLDIGEQVDALDGPMELVAAAVLPEADTVYNFEVGNDHTYFVGDAGLVTVQAPLAGGVRINTPTGIDARA